LKPNNLAFIEFLFFDVVAVAWAVWQWWSARPAKPNNDDAVGPLSPEDSRHFEG
jgi:hypothetical protein